MKILSLTGLCAYEYGFMSKQEGKENETDEWPSLWFLNNPQHPLITSTSTQTFQDINVVSFHSDVCPPCLSATHHSVSDSLELFNVFPQLI